MMDSGNHIYWNALGVISMSKGNNMHLQSCKKSSSSYLVVYYLYSILFYVLNCNILLV